MTVKEVVYLIYKTVSMPLNNKDKEAIWESFKVKPNLEDNPD